MENIVFEDVVVNNPGSKPWGDKYYYCEGVKTGYCKGTTSPCPPCFTSEEKNVKVGFLE